MTANGCSLCGGSGHVRANCPWAKRLVPAPRIAVLPCGDTDGMVVCNDCRIARVPNFHGVGGCADFVPHLSATPRHCQRFTPHPRS